MKDLIKAIRFAANMNQEQFASALGTTPLSINRWENGKTAPNRMAQTQLYNFCLENGISLYQTILDKIKAEAETIELEEGRVLLYHGYIDPCVDINHLPVLSYTSLPAPIRTEEVYLGHVCLLRISLIELKIKSE